eukprot:15395380-Alexandrium_andersonii.AAC.1
MLEVAVAPLRRPMASKGERPRAIWMQPRTIGMLKGSRQAAYPHERPPSTRGVAAGQYGWPRAIGPL